MNRIFAITIGVLVLALLALLTQACTVAVAQESPAWGTHCWLEEGGVSIDDPAHGYYPGHGYPVDACAPAATGGGLCCP